MTKLIILLIIITFIYLPLIIATYLIIWLAGLWFGMNLDFLSVFLSICAINFVFNVLFKSKNK
jgi:hypothetical protein